MKRLGLVVILGIFVCLSGCSEPMRSGDTLGAGIVHDVYFELHDNSDTACDGLVEACYKYLRIHPGVVYFSAGLIVKEHDRDVNVQDWDVSLHVVFDNKASHDLYQKAADHLKFIEENKDNWKSVRVFDSYVK